MVDVKLIDEAGFKKRIFKLWDSEDRLWYTPIQTRTVPGVPDVYCALQGTPDYAEWVEFKRIKSNFFNDKNWKLTSFIVPFRPGQQAWAAKHYMMTKRPVQCMVMFDDVAVWFSIHDIRIDRRYSKAEVSFCALDIQEAVYGKAYVASLRRTFLQ